MQFVDYYKVLGVEDTATIEEIKKSYRRLARKYHPDVSKESDAEERFKEIGEAYAILSDESRKQEYDEMRRMQKSGASFQDADQWQFKGEAGGEDFSDFFESLFRRQGSYEQRQHLDGEDVKYVLPITIEEAVMGGERTINYVSLENDEKGFPYQKNHSLKVTIPKGMISGQHLRLSGKGGAGYGNGKPGDLYLEIELSPHPKFTPEGRNLIQFLNVTPWDMALGAVVRVPTVDGAVNLSIPKNAKPGQKLRVAGKGIPGKPAGDMMVILRMDLPDVRTEGQREVFERMKKEFSNEGV